MSFKLISRGIETINMSHQCKMEINGELFTGYSNWTCSDPKDPTEQTRHAMRHAFARAKVAEPDDTALDAAIEAWNKVESAKMRKQ